MGNMCSQYFIRHNNLSMVVLCNGRVHKVLIEI